MLEFQLFRTKVFPRAQQELFNARRTRGEMLRDILNSKPSAELRSGYIWHIGNVARLDNYGIYFALGRTTTSTIELWDDQSGDFDQVEFESAPYTHVVLDSRLQICAIARKSRLAPTTAGIGRQLQKLFNKADEEILRRAEVEVTPLSDPEGFIGFLRRADSITQFGAEFSLPNPFDAEEDFQQPLEKVLRKANGGAGKAVIKGENLDAQVLEDIARSAAASGNNAEARLRLRPKDRPMKKVLKGNAVTAEHENAQTREQRIAVLRQVRDKYKSVRESTLEE